MLVGLLSWLLQLIHRRHSPTDGGNRSWAGWKFAEQVSGCAFDVVVVPGGGDVGQLVGAFVRMTQIGSGVFETAI